MRNAGRARLGKLLQEQLLKNTEPLLVRQVCRSELLSTFLTTLKDQIEVITELKIEEAPSQKGELIFTYLIKTRLKNSVGKT